VGSVEQFPDLGAVEAAHLRPSLLRSFAASWGYKAQAPAIRHLGPTAQDFRGAFGLGEDARHIDTIDSEGVALAAIQGRGTFLANRLVFIPTNNKTLLTIPGLGDLDAWCFTNSATVYWENGTYGSVDVWWDTVNSHFNGSVLPSGAQIVVVATSSG
jgi:hypothetical protein